MRRVMVCLYTSILIVMLGITVWATLDRGMLDAGSELIRYPWFLATLADAYFAFTAFLVWLAWRERSWGVVGLWVVLVMCLGSIAIAVYMLIRIYRVRNRGLEAVWQRDPVA